MDYILTNKGFVGSIILPIVMQLVILIEWRKKLSVMMRHLVVFVYFVAGVVTFILFVYFKFEKYFCYIWILTFVMSYPILFYFSKKGDCFVNNLSEQEMNKYNNISKNMLYAIGVFIIIGTFANKYLNMVDFDLDGEISVISTVLYLIWGGMCLGYAVMSE